MLRSVFEYMRIKGGNGKKLCTYMCKKDVQKFYSLPNIIEIIKLMMMGWRKHVAG
jgi:hypothetical protein